MKRIIIVIVAGLMCFSIGMAQNNKEKVVHEVEPGQTLFFISKKYNVSIEELRASNPAIGEDLIIRPGDSLIVMKTVEQPKEVNAQYVTHVVTSKETLYSLSKKFDVSVDELIRMNELETPSIQIGQVIKVQKLSLNEQALFVKETVKPNTEVVIKDDKQAVKENAANPQVVMGKADIDYSQPDKVSDKITKPADIIPGETQTVSEVKKETDSDLYKMLFTGYEKTGNTLNKDKGIGNFLESGDASSYFALVNDIAEGQVIRVRNLMNNKIVYLKVVGSLPENETMKNVSLKITPAAAKTLGIIEDRFLAEWSWYETTSSAAQEETAPEGIFITDF